MEARMPPATLTEALLAIAAGVWALLALGSLRDVLAVPPLAPLEPGRARAARAPRVSAVIPARDEEARIEGTVRRLLAQAGVEVEVLVADDRSQDRTGALVAALAAADPRVRTLRIDALPDGWLGKPHACQRAAELARGDWMLFTDGDVHLAPDVLARALELAARERADHVVLAPGAAQATFAARAVLAGFALGLVGPMARCNRDERRGWVGIGGFNLVRAEAWRAVGGHAALRYEVVDDMKLGLLLARAGFRTRARTAQQDVVAAWGARVGDVLRLLEKNQFAYFGYSVPLALFVCAALGALWLSGPLGALHGGAWGWAAFAGFLAPALPAALLAARSGEPVPPALFAPLGAIALVVALLRSTCVTLARGGVVWRGTRYPLAELRARHVR
jgi:hypothetical protein